MIKRVVTRAGAAALLAVALSAAGEARAQSHALKFHDVTEVLAPASVGTVPTDHPDIPDAYALGPNLIDEDGLLVFDGTLGFTEGDLRTYEFFAAAAGGAKASATTIRIELMGEGADAYRLSAGALSAAGLPVIPKEPSLSTTTLTLSGHGDLLRIRALRDDDLAAPAAAVLRVSFVSGGSISNLPLDFALVTIEAGRQLGISDVTDQAAAARASTSVVAWEHSEANRVRGGDHLLLGEGAARTYVLRAPLGLFTLPAMSVLLTGDGADQFKVGVGLLSVPNLDRTAVAPAANGEIVITVMAVADADADAAMATLRITQADGSSSALRNLPLELALSSVDYDASAASPFVPGDTGRFTLTPSVSEAAGGTYVTFDLAVDLGVSHGCKETHCGISLMALEIVWDDANFVLDTDAMDTALQSDSTGTIYYVAHGAFRSDDPANSAQPAASGRVHLRQDPGDADYNILYFARSAMRSKLVMLLLDSFEDTDRQIRCDVEDADSSRYCGNFQLLRLGLFTRIEPAVGERLEVEARLWRADAGDAESLLASRRVRRVAQARAVNPVVAYESGSAIVTVIPRGTASLALEPTTPSRSISTLETAETSATVAFLTIADDGDDRLPALLSVLWLKYAADGAVGAEVADLRMAVTGPGVSAPVVGERDAATNTFRFDFTALSDGGLLVADGAVGAWAVTVWMDDEGANHTYADQTSFTLSIARHMSAEMRERRFSEETIDASNNSVDFHMDIVGTRLRIAGGVDAIRETLTIPPADAKISTFTLQVVDAKGSIDTNLAASWASIPGVVTFGGAFSDASSPFVNGESQVTDARIGFAPAYGDDGNIGGITFGLDREGVDTSGPRFNFELEVHAQSLIATEPPTVTDDLAAGASLSVPLEAVAFYRQVAAGDCRRFAQNCVMDKDFNGDVAITASVGAVHTTATSDLAPVIVNFASGRAMLGLDLNAASLPDAGVLAVTLDYPALDPAHRAFAVTLATVPYDFRRLRLAFDGTLTLTTVEAAASPRICVASSVANFDDSATVEVTVALIGGTAVADEDYTLAVGDEFSLRIASGESRACHALTLIDDAIAEHEEHLEFRIAQLAYTGAGSTLTKLIRAEDTLRLVIQDDDGVTVRIAPSAVELREQTADGRIPASAHLRISLWDGLNANRFSDDLGGRRALRFNVVEGSASLSGVCPADAATILAAGDDFCLRLPSAAGADVALTAADTAAGATFSLEYERNGADRFVVEIVVPGGDALEGRDSFEIGIASLDASADRIYAWPTTATALGLGDDNPSVAMTILDVEEVAPTLIDVEGQAVTAVTLGATPSVVFHVELRGRGADAALAPDEDVAVQITISDLDRVSFVGRSTTTRTLNLVIAANTTRTAGFRLIAGDSYVPASGRVDLLARSGGADAPLPADAMASLDLLSVGRERTKYEMFFHDVTALVAPTPAGMVPIHHLSTTAAYSLGPNIAAAGGVFRFAEGDLRTYEFYALDGDLTPAASVVRIELLGEGAAAYRLSVGARDGNGLATLPPEPSLSSLTLTLDMGGGSLVGDFLGIRALRDHDTDYPPPARLRISHVLGDIFSNLPLEFALATSEPAAVDVETFVARDAADSADLILVEDNDASAFFRVSLVLPDGGGAYADVGGGVGTLTLTFESDGRSSGASLLCPDDLADLSGVVIDICVRPVADANYTLVAEDSMLHLTYRRDGQSAFWLEIVAPADNTDEVITRVNFSLGRISVGDDTWMKGRHEGVITVIDGDATYEMRFHDVSEVFAPAPVGTIPTHHPDISNFFLAGPDIAAAGALMFIEGDLRIYEFYGDAAGGKPLESVVRVELLGEGAGAYRLSADNFTIPPEPSLSSATLALSRDLYVGDILKIRALADADATPPPPARLRISRVSGELFDNLPLEFALTTLERVNVNVETFVARSAADRAPLALIEDNDAGGFLRVSLQNADSGAGYFDAAGGVGTLTLSFESAGHGFDNFSILCLDDLRDYGLSSVDVCVRPVADANYTLSAAGGTLHLTYRRDGQSMFWLEVVAPEDLAIDQTTPIHFSLTRAPESVAGVVFAPSAHEGVVTIIDTAPVLHDLRVERVGDASYATTEDYAHATTLSVTLRLSGFDQYGDAIAIRGIDEVSATSTAGARLVSFETTGAEATVATLTLTIGPVPLVGDRVTIIVRAGDIYRIESLERRTDIDVGVAPFIYGLRDITELNRGRAEGSHALRGSGPPLSADATIEIPLDGAALLEFYPVQIGLHRGALHARLHFEGGDAERYRMRSSLSPTAPPSTSSQGVIPSIGQGGLASQDWDLHAAFGFTAMTYGVIRIPAAAKTSVTTFKISHLRGDWPVADFPLSVKVRTVEPFLDVEVYPLVSVAQLLESTRDVPRSLDTRATVAAPASIALFAIADGGDNASETALNHLRVILTSVGDMADLKAKLQAFTFVLRDARVAGLIEAPESARINEQMSLMEHGDALRLQVRFDGGASPRIPDGETVHYEIVAYYSDTSVRIDEEIGFRIHFAAAGVDVRGGRVLRTNTDAGFDVDFSVVATEFRFDGLGTAGVASADTYLVSGADWPILRARGAFTDAFGNVDADVARFGVSGIDAVGVIQSIGSDVEVEVTPTAVTARHLDFGESGLTAFIAELQRLGGGDDSADGTRWTLAMRIAGALGDTSRAFTVDVPGLSPPLEIFDLRLARKLEHDTASQLSFTATAGGGDADLSDIVITGACANRIASCGRVEAVPAMQGFAVTPVLGEDYSLKYGTSLRLTFHYTVPGMTPIPAVQRVTLGARALSGASLIQDFGVLPAPIEVFFRQREYRVSEGVGDADLSIAGNPDYNRRNIPVGSALPAWRVRVAFGAAMTGYAGWSPSITPDGEGFVELEFDSVTTQLLYPVPIVDDTTYKPRETMDFRIVSVRFADGGAVRHNFGSGFATATVVVVDDDRVDVNVAAYAIRNAAIAANPLELAESNDAGAFWRFYLTEADGGGAYYDAAGGVATLTLSLSSEGAAFGASLLCRENLRYFVAVSVCVRPVADANYTLEVGAAAVALSYPRDGRHEFWLEVVAPDEGVSEGASTVTFTISAIDLVGDDVFQNGATEGVISILAEQGLELEVYPLASVMQRTEATEDVGVSLGTDATAEAPVSVFLFAVDDGGSDTLAAVLNRLSVKLTPADGDDIAGLRTRLRAFSFVLRDVHVPGVIEAPASARVNEPMRLLENGDAFALEAQFSASLSGFSPPPRIPDGNRVAYEIVAHYTSASVRIDENGEGGAFRASFIAEGFDFSGGSGVSRINTDTGFVVDFSVTATEFGISGVETAGVSGSQGVYRVAGAAWPILRARGAFTDMFGNVDADVVGGDIGVVGVLRGVGTNAVVEVTPTAVAAGRIDFDAVGLAAFIEELTRFGGAADESSQWTLAIRYKGALGDAVPFSVNFASLPAFTVYSVRFPVIEHNRRIDMAFFSRSGNRNLETRELSAVTAECLPSPDRCEPITAAPELGFGGGATVQNSLRFTVNLAAGHASKSDTRAAVTIHYNNTTAAPIPVRQSVTLSDADISGNSDAKSFNVRPLPMRIYFERSEYAVTEAANTQNASIRVIANAPASGYNNSAPPVFRVRVMFGEAMTGRADWPVSIRPSSPTFADIEFTADQSQMDYLVPIIPDSTYKPRETMALRIVSAYAVDDGAPLAYEFDAGYERTTIVVMDDDTVDVNAELYTERGGDDASVLLELTENNSRSVFMRVHMTETDGGAAYRDTAGGVGTFTLTFSSDGAGAGASTLCPDDLSDLFGLAVDLCVRPVADANYTLVDAGAGAVDLVYARDGKHEFWLEVVAPREGVEESTATVTVALSAIEVGGDPWRRGMDGGRIRIRDDSRRTRLAFEDAPALSVAEASTAQQICVEAAPANAIDAAPIELSVALIGGDAVEGEDYTLAGDDQFSLRIGAGESRACQALTLLDDALAENDEHLEFSITHAAYAGAGFAVAALVRSEDTLRLVIRNDDRIIVRIAPDAVALREQTADGRVAASANLRISLWDSLNANRFSDDLGGRRALRFNIAAGSASPWGVCPADAATILTAGDDFCLRLPADAGATTLTAVDTAAGATFSLEYERDGAGQFVVEIVAPGDGILEGAESFEVSIASLDASADGIYAWPSTTTALELADGNLGIEIDILDIEKAVLTLVDADGRALTAVALSETTPSAAFHAELREAGAALVANEDVAVQIAIGDLADVSFAGQVATARALNLVIAANTTRTAAFRLIAATDDNAISESGTLDLLARGGAAAPLPTDATASVEVTVTDDYSLSTRLAFEATSTLAVVEASAAQQICVQATPINAAPIELSVALIGGDAVAGEDYTLAGGDRFGLTIGGGESRACQALTLLDDAIAERDEYLEFRITRVAYAIGVSTVTTLIRSEAPLRLVIRNDDDITVRIAPSAVELRERKADGRVPASANLQISLWDDLNASRYSDDLGGRRALRFNVIEGLASLSGVCPADAATILTAGDDFCLRLPADAAAGVALSAVDTAAGATFSLAYERDGADGFIVEIVAPGGDALEGRDSFEIGINGLNASTDSIYVWPTTAAALGLADDHPSVAMDILDAEEPVPTLVAAGGRALTAVSLGETTPSVVLHVELRAEGATLIPDEDVDVRVTIGDLAGVSFAGRSAATRALDFIIAANTMRTATFRLVAARDDNIVSESGTLDLLARGGAAAPLPADTTASLAVTVTDDYFLPVRLAFEATSTLAVIEADAAHEICVAATPANAAAAPPIELRVALIGGTAVENEDYTLAGGGAFDLTIDAGESRACQTLTLLGDAWAEHDEHLEFRITQVAYIGASPAVTELIRSEDTLRLVIRDDDGIHVRIAPSASEFREQTAGGGVVAASANLQISLWDGLNAARYIDDLGGRRALRFSIAEGSASLSGVCPADATAILADGADFCLRLSSDVGAGAALFAADTTVGATFSLEYERDGVGQFVVEIVAPADGALEGRDSFEVSIDGLNASTDSVYIWPTAASASNLGGNNPSVAMNILDARQAAPILVGADGQAPTAVSLIESMASAVFHVELRDAGGMTLAPDEAVDVQITISGLGDVSFVGQFSALRTLDLSIAANATRTATFRLIAATDGNTISESGTLRLLARNGGITAPLAADAMASIDVTVTDDYFGIAQLSFEDAPTLSVAEADAAPQICVAATPANAVGAAPIALRVALIGGTAVEDEDYTLAGGDQFSLTIGAGESRACQALTLIDDALAEREEHLEFRIMQVAYAGAGSTFTTLVRSNDALRLVIRDDDDITVRIAVDVAELREQTAVGRISASANLRISLWDSLNMNRFSDDLGDRRALRFNIAEGSASLSGVCPADAATILAAGADFCLRLPSDAGADVALTAADTAAGATFSLEYSRDGVDRFVVEIVAPADGALEGRDSFEISIASLDASADSIYAWSTTTATALDLGDDNPSVAMDILDAEEAAPVLVDAGGSALTALTLTEGVPSSVFHVELRDAGGAALAPDEDVGFQVTLVGLIGVSFVGQSTTVRALDLSIAANATRTATFHLIADLIADNTLSGTLEILAISGGADAPLAADAAASASVTALEARRLDRLLLNGEAMPTLFLDQHSVGLRMPVSGELRLAALDQYGDPHATRVAVDASVVGGARVSGLPSSLTVRVTGADLSFEVLPAEDADAMLTLRITADGVSAEAVIDVDAVDRRPQSLNLRRLADTVVQTEFNQTLVVMFDLELRDNYGDAGRLPPTLVNLEATVDRATAVTLSPSVLVSTPTTVEVRVTPHGRDDTLTLSARVGALVATEMVGIDAVDIGGSLTLDGDDSVQVDEEGIASFVMTLGATDSAGNLVALDGEVVRFTAVVDNETIEIVSLAAVSRAGTSALSVAMASTEVASVQLSVDVEVRVRLRSAVTMELTLRARSEGVNFGVAAAKVRVLPHVAAFDVDDSGEVENDDLIVILRYLMLSPEERMTLHISDLTRNLRYKDRNGLRKKLGALNDPINDDLLDLDGDGEANSYDGRLLVRYFMFGRTFTDNGDRVGERILRLMGM